MPARPSIEDLIERNKPPRERLEGLAAMHRESFAGLSRLIGRDEGYLQRFVTRGVPSRLRPDEIALLARYLGVTPRELGARTTSED